MPILKLFSFDSVTAVYPLCAVHKALIAVVLRSNWTQNLNVQPDRIDVQKVNKAHRNPPQGIKWMFCVKHVSITTYIDRFLMYWLQAGYSAVLRLGDYL